jgi:hypothetical protein
MERFYAHVCAAQAALEERPKVLKAICMDVAANALDGMDQRIDD